jgi:hypothetical protein
VPSSSPLTLLIVQAIVKLFGALPSSPSFGRNLVVAVILLAPFSLRENISGRMDPSALERSVSHAANLIGQGKGHEPMPSDLTCDSDVARFISKLLAVPWNDPNAFMSAELWHSFAARGHCQDLFSSELSVDELRSDFSVFDGFTYRVHMILAYKDKRVPNYIDKHYHAHNIATALPNNDDTTGTVTVIDDADHNFSTQEARDSFKNIVMGNLIFYDTPSRLLPPPTEGTYTGVWQV